MFLVYSNLTEDILMLCFSCLRRRKKNRIDRESTWKANKNGKWTKKLTKNPYPVMIFVVQLVISVIVWTGQDMYFSNCFFFFSLICHRDLSRFIDVAVDKSKFYCKILVSLNSCYWLLTINLLSTEVYFCSMILYMSVCPKCWHLS